MPSKWQRSARNHKQTASGKKHTSLELSAISKLRDTIESLMIEDGTIRADVSGSHGRSLVLNFLNQVNEVAIILKADMSSRSYREKFTANYRSLLSSQERQYVPELLVTGISQGSEMFVNGDLHPLTSECQSTAAALRSALLLLTHSAHCSADTGHSEMKAQVKRQQLRDALRVFDDAWVGFERVYISHLIEIEAKSRAPLVEAINLEKQIGTPCGLQHTSFEHFLDCLSNLIAKVQLRHRRTDDTFDCDVLISASRLNHDHANSVTMILANGVVRSFAALRKYLQTVENKLDHVHPDLHLNPGLVERLTAMRQSWKLFEQWGRHGLLNDALNSMVRLARRAMKLRPSFKSMCEECDPELFLVLPRIVLLCFLDNPVLFKDAFKKFLPDYKFEAQDSPTPSCKRQPLMHNFKSTIDMLGVSHTKGNCLCTATQQNLGFDIVIQRAILGSSYDKHTLYQDVDLTSHVEVSSKVDSFMLELEGWSLELQRCVPEAWNEFTALFISCLGDEPPSAQPQDFRI